MSLQRTTSIQDTFSYSQYLFSNQDPLALADTTRHGSYFRCSQSSSPAASSPPSPGLMDAKSSEIVVDMAGASRPMTRSYYKIINDSPARHTRSHFSSFAA
eukprot:TRINITY_DN12085_c3_g5_i1.p1 TRINITY_DN12085_c3_g5~~TRINITY_DN12085_c3_g5_i1.p1  ORF type:complete len:101 (+),score=8.45 TRINITY_DN12085_c3_g5_i1:135-437(+)